MVLLQLVGKLATGLFQTHLVDKLRDFYVCTQYNSTTQVVSRLHAGIFRVIVLSQ
jgi:hypothetical protein